MNALKQGWRWFRGKSTRFQVISWIVIAFVALGVIGSVGGGSSSSNTANTTSSTAAATQPASTPPASSPPASSSTTTQSADTGRMSTGEYSDFTNAIQDLSREESDFADEIGHKCKVEMAAAQFADASDCIKEAWSGTYDKGAIVYSTIDDLKGDVADGCKTAMLRYQHALDRFVSTQDAAAKAGENLEFARFAALAKASRRLSKPFNRTQILALAACSPT